MKIGNGTRWAAYKIYAYDFLEKKSADVKIYQCISKSNSYFVQKKMTGLICFAAAAMCVCLSVSVCMYFRVVFA